MTNLNGLLDKTELSERELEIVALLHDGLTNQDIAEQTGLTLYTVKWYLKQIYSKLHVSNRTQAVNRARSMGLFGDDPPPHAVQTNLPEPLTPFFGRETELTQLAQLAQEDGARLVTLHGIGGMGKTRLALEAARRVAPQFPEGVFFVSLAQAHGSALQTIAQALNLMLTNSQNLYSELCDFLRNKRCLLLLDNFEHLLDAAPQVVSLLQQTQHMRIWVTSREVLRVQGERVITLEGLRVQDAITESSAYQLYVQRAADSLPAQLSEQEQASIHAICTLVGGMPLALELAAGWAAVLSLTEIERRLKTNLDLLAATEQDRPARQQSIRATFDYSAGLLPVQTRRVLWALGVFIHDGFTYEAAEFVAQATPPDIKRLLDAALIQRSGKGRFAFHPLIQQYVREQLQAEPSLFADARYKYVTYYLEYVMQQIHALRLSLDMRTVQHFQYEMLNLYQSWFYGLEQGLYSWLLKSAEVGYLCEMAGIWRDSDAMFAHTLAYLPPEQTLLRGRIYAFRAIYAFRLNDPAAIKANALESWALLQGTEYALDAVTAMNFYAVSLAFGGEHDAALAIIDSLEETAHNPTLPPNAYAQCTVAYARATILLAAKRYEQALPLLERKNPAPDWYESRIHLPECYLELGKVEKARARLLRLYEAGLTSGNYRVVVGAIFYLTHIDSALAERPAALVRGFTELAQIINNDFATAQLINFLGNYCFSRGNITGGKLVFRANLHMLYARNARQYMYRYALELLRALLHQDPTAAKQLTEALLQTAECPADIREAARELSQTRVAPPPEATTPFLTRIEPIFSA